LSVWLDFEKMDVRNGIQALMRSTGLNYVLDQSVHGPLTLVLEGAPWQSAMERIVKQAKPSLQVTIEEGVYHFKAGSN